MKGGAITVTATVCGELGESGVECQFWEDYKTIGFFFNICDSVHHQSTLLNNQRGAALSSRIYSYLQGYSTCFGCFLHPSSGVQLKLQMQS
jgi:hypothetical protein